MKTKTEKENKKAFSRLLGRCVKKVITNYIAKHPWEKLTYEGMAEKGHSCRTTLADIMRGKIESLSPANASKISGKFGGPTALIELLALDKEDNIKEVKRAVKRIGHGVNYTPLPEEFYDFITNPQYARLIWAAYSKAHITQESAIKYYGSENLKTLLDSGIIKEENGMIKGAAKSAGAMGKVIYDQLGIAYDLCRPLSGENSHAPMEYHFQTKSINKKFADKCKKEIRDLFIRLQREADSPENTGEKHFFLGALSGIFLDLEDPDEDDDLDNEEYSQ